jgi:hypothetical protein
MEVCRPLLAYADSGIISLYYAHGSKNEYGNRQLGAGDSLGDLPLALSSVI